MRRGALGALGCLGLALVEAQAAGPLVFDPQVERIQRLAPVTGLEVAGPQGLAVSLGRWDGPGSLGAATTRASPRGLAISRDLTTVWRTHLPPTVTLDRLRVRYEMDGASGCTGCLSAAAAADSTLPVTLIPLPPRVVRWDKDGALVEGGVSLRIDLGKVRHAGDYVGTLTWHVDAD